MVLVAALGTIPFSQWHAEEIALVAVMLLAPLGLFAGSFVQSQRIKRLVAHVDEPDEELETT